MLKKTQLFLDEFLARLRSELGREDLAIKEDFYVNSI